MSDSKSMERLRGALKKARGRLDSGRLHVVMGNEAADLDSMASAVVYAWYKAERAGQGADACVPFVPIPREDFKLRTEALYLFEAVGLSPDDLLFSGDLDLQALQSGGRLALTLVDHNKLGPAFAGLEGAVEEIVDHHQDEKLYPGAASRTIEGVGSCATLVAEKVLKAIPELLDAGCARLLLGTILLDTVNLDEKAGRVTPKDREMADRLIVRSGAAQKELFDRLQFEKFNVAALDTRDLLRKDYKDYSAGSVRYGMSSVLLSVADWAKKDPGLTDGLAKYCAERGLSLLFAMNAYTDPDFKRELVVYAVKPELRKLVVDFLVSRDLDLAPLKGKAPAASENAAFFSQGNGSYSRKKLQPLLQEFLAGV